MIRQIQELRLLTEKQVAEITGVPVGTLRHWRCAGIGSVYIKMGTGPRARVRYDPNDIEALIEAGRRYPVTVD